MSENNEIVWVVYCHINKINQKKYVGITSQTVQKRWKNGFGYISSPHFYAAIRKYGWDNFEHIVLFDDLTEQEAKQKEQELIKFWNLRDSEYGYNMTDGGEGVKGLYVSNETRRKLSERMAGKNHPYYGKKMPKEFCEAISKGRQGMKFSESHKQHLKESHTGKSLSKKQRKKISDNSPVKVKVVCEETMQIFNSIAEITKFYNKDARHVSECCKGKRDTWNGYHWQYYKDYLKGGENECEKT